MVGRMLYLSDGDTRAAEIAMAQVVEALERAYVEKGAGRVETPPKPGIHPREGALIHAMPSHIPALHAAGMKWISAYPSNPGKGLPQVAGLIVLNDEDSGLPYCVMDCRWITAMRTGAKTAVAARRLARADAKTVGIVGCGVQGRSNLEALAGVLPLQAATAYDLDPVAARAYAHEMAAKLGFPVLSSPTLEGAVREMDVVVTSVPIRRVPEPAIGGSWVASGAFLAPVDFGSCFDPAVLAGADVYATDDVQQYLHYRTLGYFAGGPEGSALTDLGALAAGKAVGRTSDAQMTVAMNLGLGMDDVAVAPLWYLTALEKGLGTWLD